MVSVAQEEPLLLQAGLLMVSVLVDKSLDASALLHPGALGPGTVGAFSCLPTRMVAVSRAIIPSCQEDYTKEEH
jgi:hypothetical protein